MQIKRIALALVYAILTHVIVGLPIILFFIFGIKALIACIVIDVFSIVSYFFYINLNGEK